MIWLLMEALITLFSRDGRRAFFDVESFAWTAGLEQSWAAIRKELDRVLLDRERIPNFRDVSADQAVLADGGQWKTYFFFIGGQKAEDNCARCPETARALLRIPGMQSAMFSILAPGTRLPPHRGLYKGVLRYHLALLVPRPDACGIRVKNETRSWQEGHSLIFDDTWRHEAWNRSDGARVVLFVDFERPLPQPLARLNRVVLCRFGRSEFTGNAIKQVRKAAAAAAKD